MKKKQRSSWSNWLVGFFLVVVIVAAFFAYPWLRTRFSRIRRLGEWLNNPLQHVDWSVKAGGRCSGAPFILPTSGYVGFIWGDSFRPGHQHQGIDIFGGEAPGKTLVVAAHDGYLSRLPDWKSTVIIRVPADPLEPGRQIWTYYTHMANKNGLSYISPDFPTGTNEKYVQAGTFLGYQGDYSGDPDNPVGVHLHFSIVKDDGAGRFRNELQIENTLDPSLYLGLLLNASRNPEVVIVCSSPGDGS